MKTTCKRNVEQEISVLSKHALFMQIFPLFTAASSAQTHHRLHVTQSRVHRHCQCVRVERWAWGDGSMGKSMYLASMRFRVRIPSTHIKSQAWPCVPEILTLGVAGQRQYFWSSLTAKLVKTWTLKETKQNRGRCSLLSFWPMYIQSHMLVNIIHTIHTHTHKTHTPKRRKSEEMMSIVNVMVFCPVSSSGIKVPPSPNAESSGSWLQASLCRPFPQPECLVLTVSLWWLVNIYMWVEGWEEAPKNPAP